MPQTQIIGIIPARYQSSRFPGKPLADILGKSLIRRTYENARRCKLLTELVVATDDQRIFNHVAGFGGEVFMTSPTCRTGTDRIAELVRRCFVDADLIVNIQGDEPCVDPEVISALINVLLTVPKSLVATAVVPISNPRDIFSPSVVKCVFDEISKRSLYFSRSPIPFPRKTEPEYYRHMGIYAYRKEFLLKLTDLPDTSLQQIEDLEQLKILEYGYPLHVCVIQDDNSIGVDTPDDLKRVENYLCPENTSLSQEVSSLHLVRD